MATCRAALALATGPLAPATVAGETTLLAHLQSQISFDGRCPVRP
jgi:hypothetical protein